jgi:hypothetical protein
MFKNKTIKYILITTFAIMFFQSCTSKRLDISQSAVIIFKTPNLKFYDKGFISRYDDYTHLQIFSVGTVVLDFKIYKDKICKSMFECVSSKEFNQEYLSKDYEDDFLYKLFLKKNIRFKDKKNKILIKVRKD